MSAHQEEAQGTSNNGHATGNGNGHKAADMLGGRETASPDVEPPAKVTVYVNPVVYKEFKKLAIDHGKTYSQLAELAFEALLQSRDKISQTQVE